LTLGGVPELVGAVWSTSGSATDGDCSSGEGVVSGVWTASTAGTDSQDQDWFSPKTEVSMINRLIKEEGLGAQHAR
jgi:hypothetical protein